MNSMLSPNPSGPASQVLASIAPSDSVSEVGSNTTATARHSWVWQYFTTTDVEGIMKNVCGAKQGFIDSPTDNNPDAPIVICNQALAIDKSASTKSMSRHLSRYHHIEAPVQTEQHTLAAFFDDGKVQKVSFVNLSINLFSFLYFSIIL
jgi:hypothetical protein